LKKACRKAVTETLLELAREDKRIIAVTSDARGSVTLEEYAKELPEQFIDAGIAEQNEVGMAAGAASCGMIPFVCAPAPFLSARSLEQIKVDVAYSDFNVKICAVSGGVSYGALGGTHHAIYDLAAIRPMENITVLLPADAVSAAFMTRRIAAAYGPVYMRMGRGAVDVIYNEADTRSFEIGKAFPLRQGRDLTVIACGEMVSASVKAADILAREGVFARVLDMHTIKPLDKDAIIAAAIETGSIVTVEEHSVVGGLGSAVAEVVVQNAAVPMKFLGIPDEHVVAGESDEVFECYGLTPEGIAKSVREFLMCKEVADAG
jgi:transketolase